MNQHKGQRHTITLRDETNFRRRQKEGKIKV